MIDNFVTTLFSIPCKLRAFRDDSIDNQPLCIGIFEHGKFREFVEYVGSEQCVSEAGAMNPAKENRR
ncbi:MAG: hypothetical protein H8D26_09495 [Methanomicrobia archaeon]|nr:hypothetical protein [Methanomicrobia archaeon]